MTSGLETGRLEAFKASATAAAMEGWSWETTEEVTEEMDGTEADLVTAVGAVTKVVRREV